MPKRLLPCFTVCVPPSSSREAEQLRTLQQQAAAARAGVEHVLTQLQQRLAMEPPLAQQLLPLPVEEMDLPGSCQDAVEWLGMVNEKLNHLAGG